MLDDMEFGHIKTGIYCNWKTIARLLRPGHFRHGWSVWWYYEKGSDCQRPKKNLLHWLEKLSVYGWLPIFRRKKFTNQKNKQKSCKSTQGKAKRSATSKETSKQISPQNFHRIQTEPNLQNSYLFLDDRFSILCGEVDHFYSLGPPLRLVPRV